MRRIAVGGGAGNRAADLLDQQKIAGLELWGDRGFRPNRAGHRKEPGLLRADRHAALRVAPAVDAQLVVQIDDADQRRRLEDGGAEEGRVGVEIGGIGQYRPRRRGRADQCRADARGELRPGRHDPVGPAAGGEVHSRVGVAPVVHAVVDETPVARRRDAVPAGVEVGFGARPGILAIAQVVAGIGQQLDQGHAEIGRQPLLPAGVAQRDQIDHQPAEALIVLRQIVERRLRQRRRLADDRDAAVEGRRAAGLEAEPRLRAPSVDPGMDEPQHVTGKVALAIDKDKEPQRLGRVRGDPGHPHAEDAHPADHRKIRGRQRRRRLQERHFENVALVRRGQRRAAVFDKVDAVERMRRRSQYRGAPVVVAADHAVEDRHRRPYPGIGMLNASSCCSPVSRRV